MRHVASLALLRWALPTLVLLAGPAAAQAPSRGWLPREVHPITGVSQAQRAEAMANIDRIERILKRVPEVADPSGFEIQPVIAGGARQIGPGFDAAPLAGSVIEYNIGLRYYRPSKAIAGEGGTCLAVTVNRRTDGRLQDATGRVIYIEGDRGRPSTKPTISDSRIPHAVQVYGELWNVPRERSAVDVLFVTAGELPWKPVSREEFYRANLFEHEGAKGEKVADVRKAMAKTPYQEWMEGAAQRKQEREATLAQMKGILPAADIARTRQTLEASERDVTERLRRSEPEHRERGNEALAKVSVVGDNMRAELAAMSEAERRMPAYITDALDRGPNATGWRLTTDEAPPAWRVLTPNYDFYRARRSPSEVRSVSVSIRMSQSCLAPKIQASLWQAYHKLDWGAFNALLVQPR